MKEGKLIVISPTVKKLDPRSEFPIALHIPHEYSGMGTIKSRLSASLETILIDRNEPTTKECFMCGHKEQMSLSDRVFICTDCGFTTHRDRNVYVTVDRM